MRSDLQILAQKPYFTTSDAAYHSISSRMLSYYVEKGILDRLAWGVYRTANYDPPSKHVQWEDLAIAASNIKNGVICLVSALSYYELTDDFMEEYWIAVPNKTVHASFPQSHIVRMRNMTTGVRKIKLANLNVKIFDMERTIIDSFRLLDFETAMKALKIYISGSKGKPKLNKISRYAKELRTPKVCDYITALIA
jgi:predicted transcriptional regulator of viral defense system